MATAYVLRSLKTGLFAKGRAGRDWTADLQKARVFPRSTDAKNSLGAWYKGHEIVPVYLSLTPHAAHYHKPPSVKPDHPQHAEITARSNHGSTMRNT